MPDNNEAQLIITSPAFENEGIIPAKYTCEGEAISPPLHIENIPDGTLTLALIVEDPDAPKGTYDHWLVWDIDKTNSIGENENPGINGKNSADKTGYHPPCPPSGSHRYYFYVFALDARLQLEPGAHKQALQEAMKPHILAKGELMGKYSKKKSQ